MSEKTSSHITRVIFDDGQFASLIIIWLGCCRIFLSLAWLLPKSMPVVMFAGLVVILAQSAVRCSGARR